MAVDQLVITMHLEKCATTLFNIFTDHLQPPVQGTLAVEARFSSPIPALGIKCLIWAEYDDQFLVDKYRKFYTSGM